MIAPLTVLPPRGVARSFDPSEMLADWRADMQLRAEAGELAHNTLATYYRGMAKFLAWREAQGVERIGPRAIRSWKAALLQDGRKPAGVNTLYAGVRAFFRWAVAEQGLAYDPTASVQGASRRGASRRHKRDVLTDAEVLRLLAQVDASTDLGKRDSALLHLLAYTALRTVEAQRARLEDLRTDKHLMLFVHGKGHAEADEPVYLVQPDLVAAMYDWLAVHPRGDDLSSPLFCGLGNRNKGGALTTRTLRGLVKAYYAAAGIRDPRKTTHSLRHTVVSNLIRHGVAPTKIMSVTRHRSLDTMLAYVHELERDADPAEGYVEYNAAQ